MAYVLSADFGDDPELFKFKYRQYREYLESIRAKVSPSVHEFATGSWRDGADHRALHDSWVEWVRLRELSTGERQETRWLEIEVRLLGPYHDGHTLIVYQQVESYALEMPRHRRKPPPPEAHGDWVYDEITLADNGLVRHEIEFGWGSKWIIECKDLTFSWQLIGDGRVDRPSG